MELTQQKISEIQAKVQQILLNNFSGPKTQLKIFRDRLNFACPYCGDSSDPYKKRGNIYYKTLAFHCFNSGCPKKHTDLLGFFKDFNSNISNKDDLIFYLDYIRTNQVKASTREYMKIEIFERMKEYAIPLSEVKEKFNLRTPSENFRIERYLKGRFMHQKLHHFMYNEKEEQLYIFNLSPDLNSCFGWQIRNFKPEREKYISYNIEKINQIVRGKQIEAEPEEIMKMNTLSIFFNITNVDFTKPVTVFEGPIDSFLCSNSIAISGIDKPTDMFDEIPSIRYFFDNDKAGKRVMESKLKKRKKVFMWEKLLRDFKIQPRLAKMDKIKDFNDLLKYCWTQKNDAVKNFDKYFTENPLDIRSV